MAQKRKHTPQRTCVICREVKPKQQLIRLVRSADSKIEIDLSGKKPGRGAYLCDNSDCWTSAATGRVLEKALRTTLTSVGLQRLEIYFQENINHQEEDQAR